jgi:hypothetical protein
MNVPNPRARKYVDPRANTKKLGVHTYLKFSACTQKKKLRVHRSWISSKSRISSKSVTFPWHFISLFLCAEDVLVDDWDKTIAKEKEVWGMKRERERNEVSAKTKTTPNPNSNAVIYVNNKNRQIGR